jgi:molybdopterin synthase sulfur carrier subunit
MNSLPKVTVKYFATVREIAGKKEDVFQVEDGATVESLLQILSKMYGSKFENYVFDEKTHTPRDYLQFLVDGKSASTLQGLKTKITDGCQFAIIPPVGGG